VRAPWSPRPPLDAPVASRAASDGPWGVAEGRSVGSRKNCWDSTTISHLNTPDIFIQTYSEFGDGQDFEHSKSIVFARSGECHFGLDSRQRGEMFKPVLGRARDVFL